MNRVLFITVLLALLVQSARAIAAEESALEKKLYGQWTREDGNVYHFSPTTFFRVVKDKCYMLPLRIIDESSLFSTVLVRLDPERGDNAMDWMITLSGDGNGAMVSWRSREAARAGVIYVPNYKKAAEMPLSEIPFYKPATPYRRLSDARSPTLANCVRSP